MYHLSPLSSVPENIDLPTCMYSIKPINSINTSASEGLPVKRVKMDPELQTIEERQLQVIARLRQIRDTVNGLISKNGGGGRQDGGQSKTRVIKQSLSSSKASTTAADLSNVLADAVLPSELVIEANPSRPPLSLVLFRNLSPDIRTMSHVHSTCKQDVDPKLTSLFLRDVAIPNTTIRVVWKDGKESKLMPPMLGSSAVIGESNLARYLSRVLAKPDSVLNYDALTVDDLVLVDGVLESSELVDISPDHFLNSLQAYVQSRSGRSGPSTRTIADFVGYSTLRYLTKQRSQQSFQKSLIDWMNCLTNEVPALC